MKLAMRIMLGILIICNGSSLLKAQNVTIEIPAQNIFNQTEFITEKNVLNTRHHTNWRIGFFAPIHPTIRSTSGDKFSYSGNPSVFLPTTVLHWRLASIGGKKPPFRSGDTWPVFKWFTPNEQTWYQPGSTTGGYNPGNVTFTFKIPSNEWSNNAFRAGNYSMGVTHNYGSSGLYTIEFIPDSFHLTLSIPWAISWIAANPMVFAQISSLNDFRNAPTQIETDLGSFILSNTIDFKLFAKSASPDIQFLSSKGVSGYRDISILNLTGSNPKIRTFPLSSTEKDFTPSEKFTVEKGNRNNFRLGLAVSRSDFRTHFFQAGTYKFQLNLNAKSTDNSIYKLQDVDFSLTVPPLSEITLPAAGHEVNFEFNTVSQYQNGQTKVIPNHLKLSNNETYELYVKSDVSFFRKAGIQSDVPSSILQIGVEGGSSIVPLSSTAQRIINNGTPVLDMNLNMKYVISASSAQTLVAKEKNTYSLNVIYSFTAL